MKRSPPAPSIKNKHSPSSSIQKPIVDLDTQLDTAAQHPNVFSFSHSLDRIPILAPVDSPEEQRARASAEQAKQHTPDTAIPLTEDAAHPNEKIISQAGQQYFQSVLGATIPQAKIHVNEQAAQLAKLTKANALTYGKHIYIPKANFSPASSNGRALLGHELAHVVQSPRVPLQIFRDGPPYYPSVDEQAKIEQILSRDKTKTKTVPASLAQPSSTTKSMSKTVRERLKLHPSQCKQMADRLRKPLTETITSKFLPKGTTLQKSLNTKDALATTHRANNAVADFYGKYLYRGKVGFIQDGTLPRKQRRDQNKVLLEFNTPSNAGSTLVNTIVDTDCSTCHQALQEIDESSKAAVIQHLIDFAKQDLGADLERAGLASIKGSYNAYSDRIRLPLTEAGFFHAAVHELIHAYTHPAFRAAFGEEKTINEGFTEFFTMQIVRKHLGRQPGVRARYQTAVNKIHQVLGLIRGSRPFASSYPGEASREESLRQAYFQGKLEFIGWQPIGDREEKVARAGIAPWNPKIAYSKAAKYKGKAQEAQAAKPNILGVGLFFPTHALKDPTISVRYARVLYESSPYSRWRLSAEAQLMGSPFNDLKMLGGSLGFAGEYQEPYFYLSGGARFSGTAADSSHANRLDISPFVGAGARLWQLMRVGAEGFILFPLLGSSDPHFGVGLTLGVEFE